MRRRAKDRYDVLDDVLVSQGSIVQDEEHTQVIGGLCTLIERLWIHGRSMEVLYRQSVKLRLTDAAILLERSKDRRERCAESGESSSSASENSTKWKEEGK